MQSGTSVGTKNNNVTVLRNRIVARDDVFI